MPLKDLVVRSTPDEIITRRLNRIFIKAEKKIRTYYKDDRIAMHVVELFKNTFKKENAG